MSDLFASTDIALFEDLPGDSLDEHPAAPDTIGIVAPGVHTTANAHENLAGTLCGEPILRDGAVEFSPPIVTRSPFLAA